MIDATAIYEAALTSLRTLSGDPHYPALQAVADTAANDAIERCATVCDKAEQLYLLNATLAKTAGEVPDVQAELVAAHLAAAIRALKG